MRADSSKLLLDYEVKILTTVLAADYLKQPPDRWGSLKEVYDHYVPMTDVRATYLRIRHVSVDQLSGSICKLIAIELRKQHLHVANRLFIGGKTQSTIWRTELELHRFFFKRNDIPFGVRGSSNKLDFDLTRKWTPEKHHD